MSHRPFNNDRDGFRPWTRDGDRPQEDREEFRPHRGGGDRRPWQGRDSAAGGGRDFRRDDRDDRRGRFNRDDRRGERGGDRPWESRRRDDWDAGDRGGRDDFRRDSRRDDRRERGGGFERKPWQGRDSASGGGRDFRRDDRRDDRRERGGGFGGDRPWESRRRDDWGARERGGRDDFRRDFRRDDRRGDRRDRGGGGFERKPWQGRDSATGGGRDFRRDDRRERGGGFERKPWEQRRERRAESDAAPAKQKFPEAPMGELIYGRQPVIEIMRAERRNVREVLFADGVKSSEDIAAIEALCLERSIGIRRFERAVFDAWLNAANHQGVIAVCDEFNYSTLDEIIEAVEAEAESALVVLLDHIVDPQNLGSLLRSCEAAGVVGVVIPSDRAVAVTPAAVRASAGAAEHLRVTIVPSLSSTIEKLKDKDLGVWVTGLEASEDAKPYSEIDLKGKVALVIGSEGAGLSRSVRDQCDFLAKLPMLGKIDSLNAGVAGALAMYEVLRQQGRK